jgi:hypothetical protein
MTNISRRKRRDDTMKGYVLVTVLLFSAVLIFGCIGTEQFPIKGLGLSRCKVKEPYNEEVPYVDIVYYTENESYEVQEPYTKKECNFTQYTERGCNQENINYSITSEECWPALSQCTQTELFVASLCTVNNLDSIGGNFTIYIGYSVESKNLSENKTWYMGENRTLYIYPKKSQNLIYSNKVDNSTCTGMPYDVIENLNVSTLKCFCTAQSVPTREVCRDVLKTREECCDVTKYRNVTMYGNVTKSRSVTKYKTVTRYKTVEEVC